MARCATNLEDPGAAGVTDKVDQVLDLHPGMERIMARAQAILVRAKNANTYSWKKPSVKELPRFNKGQPTQSVASLVQFLKGINDFAISTEADIKGYVRNCMTT